MIDQTKTTYKKTVHITTVVCGLLFASFSFVYLYVFQRDVVEALHFSLSHGKTTFAPIASALVVTFVLLLVSWGVNALLKLKDELRGLCFVPSFLALCALTDIDSDIFKDGNSYTWSWLFPLLTLLFVGGGVGLRILFRSYAGEKGSSSAPWVINLFIMLTLSLLTAFVGNTDREFHYELAAERGLRGQDYCHVLSIGKTQPKAGHTLTALRGFALAHSGKMGEKLFCYPQAYGAEGLFFDADAGFLRYTNDSIYQLLGRRPYYGENHTAYLRNLCYDGDGSHLALDYYLSALLLDRRLPDFAQAIGDFYAAEDSLPRHYREAIALYRTEYPANTLSLPVDSLMLEQFATYRRNTASELSVPEQIGLKREYEETYWWYFDRR